MRGLRSFTKLITNIENEIVKTLRTVQIVGEKIKRKI